jgi:hypothetical protein
VVVLKRHAKAALKSCVVLVILLVAAAGVAAVLSSDITWGTVFLLGALIAVIIMCTLEDKFKYVLDLNRLLQLIELVVRLHAVNQILYLCNAAFFSCVHTISIEQLIVQ